MSKSRVSRTYDQHAPGLLAAILRAASQQLPAPSRCTLCPGSKHKTADCALILSLAPPGHQREALQRSLRKELSEEPSLPLLPESKDCGRIPEPVFERILVPLVHGKLPQLADLHLLCAASAFKALSLPMFLIRSCAGWLTVPRGTVLSLQAAPEPASSLASAGHSCRSAPGLALSHGSETHAAHRPAMQEALHESAHLRETLRRREADLQFLGEGFAQVSRSRLQQLGTCCQCRRLGAAGLA